MKRILALLALSATASMATAQQPVAAPFVCGGVGHEEQQSMKAQAAQHDLMLTFAGTGGAYMASVDVKITDAKGHVVLETVCEGPLMLVDLPSDGRYRVSAQADGRTVNKRVSVGGRKPVTAVFTWPVS